MKSEKPKQRASSFLLRAQPRSCSRAYYWPGVASDSAHTDPASMILLTSYQPEVNRMAMDVKESGRCGSAKMPGL